MLDSFRKASQSWYIKLLFVLLILSFGVWGIGDVIRTQADQQPAISVGKEKISAPDVAEEFRRDTERLATMFGGKLSADQARQLGLLQRTVQQMVNRSLLNQAAGDLRLGADEETLRRIIADTPAFQNELHVFDKAVYQRTLIRAGLTERQFLAMEKSDIARQQLGEMVGGGVAAPATLADPLFRYRQESRVAETITFPSDKMPLPARPADDVLKQFHQAHSAMFMSPEMRGFSAIVVHLTDVSQDIKIADADVEKSYQIRQGEFQTPETRAVRQVLFADADKAKAFADAAKTGDFAAKAKEAGAELSDLGTVDAKSLPIEALADAAFSAKAPGIVGPVESPLGWHVLEVSKIVPGASRPIAEVKAQITRDLVKDEATNRLYALSTKMEDAVGSGAGIDEIASTLGLKAVKVATIDQQGQGPDGKPAAANLPPVVLAHAFQMDNGSTSEVLQLDDNSGYYILHVDQVSPPALKPFDAVKDRVLGAWNAEQQEQEARRQADAAAERGRKGEALSSVGGPYKVETTKPFLRAEGERPTVPPLLAAEMFKQPAVGGISVVTIPGGAMVARLAVINPSDPKTQAPQFDAMRKQLTQALSDDLSQQYLLALQKDYGVKINNALIEAQFQK